MMAQNPILDILLKATKVGNGTSLDRELVAASDIIGRKAAHGQVSPDQIRETLGFIESDNCKKMNQWARAVVAGVVLTAAKSHPQLDDKTKFASGWVVSRALADLPRDEGVAKMTVVATKLALNARLTDVPQQIIEFLVSRQEWAQEYLGQAGASSPAKDAPSRRADGSERLFGKLIRKFRKS